MSQDRYEDETVGEEWEEVPEQERDQERKEDDDDLDEFSFEPGQPKAEELSTSYSDDADEFENPICQWSNLRCELWY